MSRSVKVLALEQADEYPWRCPVVAAQELRKELRDPVRSSASDEVKSNEVWSAYWNAEMAKERLIKEVDSLRQSMYRVAVSLEGPCPSVNSLGEVQGQGSMVDVACAIYYRECELLTKWLIENYPDRFAA